MRTSLRELSEGSLQGHRQVGEVGEVTVVPKPPCVFLFDQDMTCSLRFHRADVLLRNHHAALRSDQRDDLAVTFSLIKILQVH